jgi:hypothetical protein
MSNAVAEKPEKLERKRPTLKRAADLKKEFDSRSVKMDQKPAIDMGSNLEDPFERNPDIFVPENDILPEDLDLLAFNEEPVKIMIHRSAEMKFQPKTTDLICVNGIKAEMLFRNGWVQIGYLPRGQAVYTKRKYVEQLAHAKVDHVSTEHEGTEVERPKNFTKIVTSASCTFSVLEDKNPRGAAWLEAILRNQS